MRSVIQLSFRRVPTSNWANPQLLTTFIRYRLAATCAGACTTAEIAGQVSQALWTLTPYSAWRLEGCQAKYFLEVAPLTILLQTGTRGGIVAGAVRLELA